MLVLIKKDECSGIWKFSQGKKKETARNDEVTAWLNKKDRLGNLYVGAYRETGVNFQIDKKNSGHAEITFLDGMKVGALDFPINAVRNIDWSIGPVKCSLEGYPPYLITKRADTLLIPNANAYIDFIENERVLATSTTKRLFFFKSMTTSFAIISRQSDDLDSWFIALISEYIHSIDGRFSTTV